MVRGERKAIINKSSFMCLHNASWFLLTNNYPKYVINFILSIVLSFMCIFLKMFSLPKSSGKIRLFLL